MSGPRTRPPLPAARRSQALPQPSPARLAPQRGRARSGSASGRRCPAGRALAPAPQPSAAACVRGAYGIRTRAAAVRGRCPRPLDECARQSRSVAANGALPARARTVEKTSRRAGGGMRLDDSSRFRRGRVTHAYTFARYARRGEEAGGHRVPRRLKRAGPLLGSEKAAGLGFEPRLLGPEPSVLPLDDPATCRCGRRIVAEPSRVQAVRIMRPRLPSRRIARCRAPACASARGACPARRAGRARGRRSGRRP